MPRRTQQMDTSIDAIIEESVARVMRDVAQRIAQKVATTSAARLEAELNVSGAVTKTVRAKTATPKQQARRAGEIDKWIPDKRARRVPTFVIEMTGLDTKKKIVEKFGADVVFKKGHPAPKAHASA